MLVHADRSRFGLHRLPRFTVRLGTLGLAGASLLGFHSPSVASSVPAPDADPAEIREAVAEQLQALERVYFRIGGRERELIDLDQVDDGIVVIFEHSTLLLKTGRNGAPNGKVGLYTEWGAASGSDEPPPGSPLVSGKLARSKSDGDLRLNEAMFGAGTTRFEIDGSRAVLRGVLGSRTYSQLDELIQEHPEVRTIVLQEVPGSLNDEINVHTGRLLRSAGLSTLVPADGMAASGGVDLFAAGVERIAKQGARLGIHAWCCYRGRGAQEIKRGHRAHQHQEAYFGEMMGRKGIDFYYRTLEAAPPDDVHWMTREELESSGLLTDDSVE